jgi:hypothetical protein
MTLQRDRARPPLQLTHQVVLLKPRWSTRRPRPHVEGDCRSCPAGATAALNWRTRNNEYSGY